MSYTNDAARHDVYLGRIASGALSDADVEISRLYAAIRTSLKKYDAIDSQAKVDKLTESVDKAVNTIYSGALDEMTKTFSATAAYEASFFAKLTGQYVEASLKAPSESAVNRYISSSIMSLTSGSRTQAGTWAQFVKANITGVADSLNAEIVAGYGNGETVSQIVKRVRGALSDAGYVRRELTTIARTGLQHYAIQAREAMAQDNLDILDRRYFNSVFDNRRTLTCAGFHGKTWLLTDASYPHIPAHYGCRSNWLFMAKGQKEIGGTRQSVGSQKDSTEAYNKRKDRLDALRDKRAEQRADGKETPETASQVRYKGKKDMDIFKPGQIDADIGVESWLRQQDRWFVESNLGVTKAKLFLDGNMKISSFTDVAGKPLTLNQLRQLDAEAFKRAGVP